MIERKFINPVKPIQNNGSVSQYAIEDAAWIWHPDFSPIQEVFLTFVNEFEIAEELSTVIHVSADERYELFVDGELISSGPDRSGLEHWSFASYEVIFSPGRHVLRAEAHWLGKHAPHAQMSSHPGFILAADKLENVLSTGVGKWLVGEKRGISFGGGAAEKEFGCIGGSFVIDGKGYFAEIIFKEAIVVREQKSNQNGAFYNFRNLFPTSMPEQKRGEFIGGRLRAVNSETVYPVPFTRSCERIDPALNFIEGTIEIPPNTQVNLLWDLDEYFCAYSAMTVSGGEGAKINMEWAESLYFPLSENETYPSRKGNRDDVEGKIFSGIGDTFLPDGGSNRLFKSFWWRSGRYVLISVATANEALIINRVALETTRYPLENESIFHCSETALEEFIPIGVRGLQMCSHETFMDCPYYEQLMYVGDSRLELMTWYAISGDDRLPKRCLQLFDWSRWKTGFVAERYPSIPYQLSLTFSTIWVFMLSDFMMWRDDESFLRDRLVGMRSLLENFRDLVQDDGLLHALPGWSFVDWVGSWDKYGMPPTDESGLLSVVNLQFVYALRKAAEIERFIGEEVMAMRDAQLADSISERILEVFWNEEASLLADNPSHDYYSEHAQCLGFLTDTIPEDKVSDCFVAMLEHPSIARTTIYFSFYLFETYQMMDRGDLILSQMDLWKNLKSQGFKTTSEQPEPSRSDCHAWGAHPIFHFHATLSGIRPTAPGFKELSIKPSPGDLEFIESKIPHPNGTVSVSLEFTNGACCGSIELPMDTTGIFEWKDQKLQLKSGMNSI